MKTRTGRRFGVTALLVCLLAFAAGCGGGNKNNDNNGAAGTTTAADSGGVAEATKFVADHLANPTKVPLGYMPLGKAPPKGKSVVFLECGVPTKRTSAMALLRRRRRWGGSSRGFLPDSPLNLSSRHGRPRLR